MIARHLIRAAKLLWLLGPLQATRFALSRFRGDDQMQLRLGGLPHPVECRPRGSDVQCLWQIFGLRDCQVELPEDPEVIIDAGANVGYASVFYATKYPGARIIAVEPDRENLAVAAANLSHYSNVTLVRGGLWSRRTNLVIENPEDQPWAFRVKETDEAAADGFPGFTLSGLLRDLRLDHVDLVKIDIEGAEKEVFARGPLDWLDLCRVLVIEVHGAEARDIVEEKIRQRCRSVRRRGEKLVYRLGADPDEDGAHHAGCVSNSRTGAG